MKLVVAGDGLRFVWATVRNFLEEQHVVGGHRASEAPSGEVGNKTLQIADADVHVPGDDRQGDRGRPRCRGPYRDGAGRSRSDEDGENERTERRRYLRLQSRYAGTPATMMTSPGQVVAV